MPNEASVAVSCSDGCTELTGLNPDTSPANGLDNTHHFRDCPATTTAPATTIIMMNIIIIILFIIADQLKEISLLWRAVRRESGNQDRVKPDEIIVS